MIFEKTDTTAPSTHKVGAALAAPREALADCRTKFASLLAYYGENPAAAPRDTEFWQVREYQQSELCCFTIS